jgi:signal transduction histidine kinase
LAVVLGIQAAAQTALPATGILTNLDTVLRLSMKEARGGRSVKATGTVTYCHPEWQMLFVQGAELGTFLKIPTDMQRLRPGDVVEIEGTTTATNGFAELTVNRVKPTGQRKKLAGRSWSLDKIVDGHASGQWVQIEGRVVAAFGRDGRLLLETAVGSTNLTAFLLNWQPEQARQLLDSRVRITGVVSVQFDAQGHRTDIVLLAQEAEQVQVLQAAASSPLDLPVTPVGQLRVSGEGNPVQRIHIQGVIEQAPGSGAVAVREGSDSVPLRCLYKPELPPDSTVDVFGYPGLVNGELVLKDAVVLPTGSTTTPRNDILPGSVAAHAAPPLLEAVQAIRQLKTSEAARGYPVLLEAVVTFSDPAWRSVFVQDATGGIFVIPVSSGADIRPGQRVRVKGVTQAGDYAPSVSQGTFEVLGEGPMPTAVKAPVDGLMTGEFDCRWVEFRGVVQSAAEKDGRCWLYVMTTQGQITALLGPAITIGQAEELVDARVTLRGVAGGEFNGQGQIVAVRVHVPGMSSILVDEAPPTDAFAVPTRRIADLSRYQPDQDVPRRIKICGCVTSVGRDQTISLQDESGGMRVTLARYDQFPRMGDRVEVLGFPTAGDFSVTLKDANSRIAGRGQDPRPLVATPEQIITNEPNGRLVQIEARLIQDAFLQSAKTLELEAGSVIFEAVLPWNLSVYSDEPLTAGTRLRVTGVCLVEGGRWGQVKSFRLLLRKPGDLKVISRPPWWNLRRLLWTLAGSVALGTLLVGWNFVLTKKNRLLREHVLKRERAEAALQQAHNTLERRVAERTAELREEIAAREKAHAELAAAQKDLMKASHEAGMAEVATGVLHNVGNVLNSINVSATVIREKLRRSEFSTLGKLRDLLQQHEGDLPAFLTTDPKGKLVPGFVIKLADNVDKELLLLQEEHENLARYIEHIKEIVAMQQMYACCAGAREKLSLAGLVDDALQINAAGFARYGIQVVRHYAEVPAVTVDKHKVLQILVNLITNAKHALDESPGPERQLRLEIARNGNNRLKVAVSDNGIGIPPENLTRVFSYGFTTRKDGHGFGLHSGANAAKEMGGQLTARSEGVGKGATFTLEIPLDPQ